MDFFSTTEEILNGKRFPLFARDEAEIDGSFLKCTGREGLKQIFVNLL